ncbi:MAG: undecaprenyl-diphosphatase [Gaiellaceae bacterium]|nr:undecaprenyl-diphosphatase [Gaiellaceae bacterium]
MSGIDGSIAVWVATHRIGFLNDPSVWLGTIEKLGAVWIVIALLVAAARRVGVVRTIAFGVFTGLTTLAADSLAFLVKDATHRTRPFLAHPQIHPLYVVHSSSFPAGHAATAFAGAVLLSAVAPRLTPVLLVLATLIAYSRIYDGVHYLTDVLAGALLGAAVAVVAVLLLRRFGPAGTVRAYA